jgi:hypothetical protein
MFSVVEKFNEQTTEDTDFTEIVFFSVSSAFSAVEEFNKQTTEGTENTEFFLLCVLCVLCG